MFRDKLVEVRRGVAAADTVPRRRLVRLGRSLDIDDVAQALSVLAQLGDQRDVLTGGDGEIDADEAEAVWQAQRDISTVLAHVRRPLLLAVADGLWSTSRHVRFFTSGALLMAADRSTLPALVSARTRETDELTRRVLSEAIALIGAARGLGRWR